MNNSSEQRFIQVIASIVGLKDTSKFIKFSFTKDKLTFNFETYDPFSLNNNNITMEINQDLSSDCVPITQLFSTEEKYKHIFEKILVFGTKINYTQLICIVEELIKYDFKYIKP